MQKIIIPILFLFQLFTVHSNAQSGKAKIYFIDTHNDVLSKEIITGVDLAKEQPETNFDLPKAKEGTLAAQVFSIWCDETLGKGKAYAWANREIDSLNA